MTRQELLDFLRQHELAVEASVSDIGAPQAALVHYVVSDDFEIIFDTRYSDRKAANLRRNPRVALVVGWDSAQSLQIEGLADEPRGPERDRVRTLFFRGEAPPAEVLANGGMTYIRVRPTWARYCDFRGAAPHIVEFSHAELTPGAFA
jgi:hypothetical protein